jgi:hypothetical protein
VRAAPTGQSPRPQKTNKEETTMQIIVESEKEKVKVERVLDSINDGTTLREMADLLARLPVSWNFTYAEIIERLFLPALDALNLPPKTKEAFERKIFSSLGKQRRAVN